MTINRILIPVDFSKTSSNALGYALYLANHFKAKCIMFHVVTIFDDDPYNTEKYLPDLADYYEHIESVADTQLREILSQDHELNIDYKVQRGFSPADEILLFSRENDIDLIVMGTHGRGAIGHFLMGSVAEKVVKKSDCPVMTCRNKPDEQKVLRGFQNILLPTDFSESSKRAGQYSLLFLPEQNGRITLLHIISDAIHPAYYLAGESSIFDLIPDLTKRARKTMINFSKDFIPDTIEKSLIIDEGDVAHEITEYVKDQDIDLVVMSTRGVNDLEHFIMGSVAERVVREAGCPVISVK